MEIFYTIIDWLLLRHLSCFLWTSIINSNFVPFCRWQINQSQWSLHELLLRSLQFPHSHPCLRGCQHKTLPVFGPVLPLVSFRWQFHVSPNWRSAQLSPRGHACRLLSLRWSHRRVSVLTQPRGQCEDTVVLSWSVDLEKSKFNCVVYPYFNRGWDPKLCVFILYRTRGHFISLGLK